MATNPNKYVRKAYLTALGNVTIGSVSVPIYDRRVPISVDPIPTTRIIISSQTLNLTDENKCDHGWECSMLLDIISEQSISFINTAIVDDIEEQVISAIDLWSNFKTEFLIPPFICYHTKFSDSHDIEIETDTTTIIRKLVRFTHRLNYL